MGVYKGKFMVHGLGSMRGLLLIFSPSMKLLKLQFLDVLGLGCRV